MISLYWPNRIAVHGSMRGPQVGDGRQGDVSVAMATYNGGAFVAAQLASIAAQTLRPSEIIICDDGSTDNTIEVLESFAANSEIPITIARNPTRLGYADNFLKAANLTTGTFVSFSDQDDYWYPHKLERSVRALCDNDALLTGHPVRLITANGKPKLDGSGELSKLTTQEIVSNHVYAPNRLDPWGVFLGFTQTIDRRLLDIIPAENRGLDSHDFVNILPHDRWTYFLGTHFGRTAVVQETVADDPQHDTNTYGATHNSFLDRFRIKVEAGPQRLKQFADLATYRVEMLLAARNTKYVAEFDAAIRRWEIIHNHCQRRFNLYRAPSLIRRGGYLLDGVVRGSYRGCDARTAWPFAWIPAACRGERDVRIGLDLSDVP